MRGYATSQSEDLLILSFLTLTCKNLLRSFCSPDRTWIEVRDLSLNFFLVAPALHLPFSPTVHPALEGVFNLLLSWAAMFSGFLSEGRPGEDKGAPRGFTPFARVLVGMQFLTSAFFLPYLALRDSEKDEDGVLHREDVTGPYRLIGESKAVPAALGAVGVSSVAWGLFARADEFGGLAERWSSFVALLEVDRVGSSFLVDLAVFAIFQGWLVDDDVKRRGGAGPGVEAARYVPFFGLAFYLLTRPPLPSK